VVRASAERVIPTIRAAAESGDEEHGTTRTRSTSESLPTDFVESDEEVDRSRDQSQTKNSANDGHE